MLLPQTFLKPLHTLLPFCILFLKEDTISCSAWLISTYAGLGRLLLTCLFFFWCRFHSIFSNCFWKRHLTEKQTVAPEDWLYLFFHFSVLINFLWHLWKSIYCSFFMTFMKKILSYENLYKKSRTPHPQIIIEHSVSQKYYLNIIKVFLSFPSDFMYGYFWKFRNWKKVYREHKKSFVISLYRDEHYSHTCYNHC